MLLQFKSYENYYKKGVYIRLEYKYDSVKKLYKYLIDNNIPNHINMNDIHTTLLYSKKCLDGYIPENKLKNINVKPLRFEMWKTCENSNCLVLLVENKNINKLHNYIVKYYKGKHFRKQFIPHITLSYDIDINYNYKELKIPDFDLIINNEIMYNTDWKFAKLRGHHVELT